MLDEVKHVQICVDFLYILKPWKLQQGASTGKISQLRLQGNI